ncbi:hypothetical protein [Methanomethylophilus alvi]|uniref:hypothetical protein n=1 Tax=Methanomethylophilus alvi TaxID=1291540 RepID=UPI0037DDA590
MKLKEFARIFFTDLEIAKAFFGNFAMLMKMDPLLGIKRVSLYADGNEIERTIRK